MQASELRRKLGKMNFLSDKQIVVGDHANAVQFPHTTGGKQKDEVIVKRISDFHIFVGLKGVEPKEEIKCTGCGKPWSVSEFCVDCRSNIRSWEKRRN
jgi:hypothetical protein